MVEERGLSSEIVYDRVYSPADGIIAHYEGLHPVKVILIFKNLKLFWKRDVFQLETLFVSRSINYQSSNF